MYAVIKTGGKQYRVAADQKIQIEKLAGQAGDQVQFANVLMVADGNSVDIGAPYVAGATVVGEIASQDRGPHIIIFKKRRRKHYRRRNGHRQDLTSVTIHEILTGGAKPAARAVATGTELEMMPVAVAPEEIAQVVAEPVAVALEDAAPVVAEPVAVGLEEAAPVEAVPAAAEPAAFSASVEAMEAAPVATNAEDAVADDISLISGIGPKLHKGLTALGITTFAQIAAWSEADIAHFDAALTLRGRVEREKWVEQAKEFMAGTAATKNKE